MKIVSFSIVYVLTCHTVRVNVYIVCVCVCVGVGVCVCVYVCAYI